MAGTNNNNLEPQKCFNSVTNFNETTPQFMFITFLIQLIFVQLFVCQLKSCTDTDQRFQNKSDTPTELDVIQHWIRHLFKKKKKLYVAVWIHISEILCYFGSDQRCLDRVFFTTANDICLSSQVEWISYLMT